MLFWPTSRRDGGALAVFARQTSDHPPARRFVLAGDPDLLRALLCRQARLSARDLPSSLARNSEQNDNNRRNPHRAISIGMHHCLRVAVASSPENEVFIIAGPIFADGRSKLIP
jgi:hypothetical protein